jgi:hypothetical protein
MLFNKSHVIKDDHELGSPVEQVKFTILMLISDVLVKSEVSTICARRSQGIHIYLGKSACSICNLCVYQAIKDLV